MRLSSLELLAVACVLASCVAWTSSVEIDPDEFAKLSEAFRNKEDREDLKWVFKEILPGPPLGPATCDALRDSNNNLVCNDKAYRVWLVAGQEGSEQVFECLDDLRELPKQCDMTEYFERMYKINRVFVGPEVLNNLEEFLDERFIAEYTKNNTGEPELHLGTNKDGVDCCKNVTDSFLPRILEESEAEFGTARDSGEMTREELQKMFMIYARDRIIEPCQKYVEVMNKYFFGHLMDAVEVFAEDDWSFLAKQSDKFRRGVFRFQWCAKFNIDNSEGIEKEL
jgi:hypothetical protein